MCTIVFVFSYFLEEKEYVKKTRKKRILLTSSFKVASTKIEKKKSATNHMI